MNPAMIGTVGPDGQPLAAAAGGEAVAAAPAHVAPPAAPPSATPFRAPGTEGDTEEKDPAESAAESDMDDDEFENQMSLAAIEAELKPKVVETFDKIAQRVQKTAPPAGAGHCEPAAERDAVALAGAQVQEAEGRNHRRGEVAAPQPGPHRLAGRAALRHQQEAGLVRGPPAASRRQATASPAKTS